MAPSHVWTPQQKAIFEWFATGTRNLIVQARAGSAKTTTLIEGVKLVPNHTPVLFTAFNKHSATDLEGKLAVGKGGSRTVKTLHALGYQILREKMGNVRVDGRHTKSVIETIAGRGKFLWKLAKLTDTVKDAAPWAKTEEEVIACGTTLDVLLDNDKEMAHKNQAQIVLSAMRASLTLGNTISFSDMVFIPYRMGWSTLDKFDLICVDELQDVNPGQLDLALRCVEPTRGRVIAVGDLFQCIYAFRGATKNVFEIVKQQLDAIELPLTVSFRCSKAVVAEARKIVPDIQVLKTAIDGAVDSLYQHEMLDEITNILSDTKNKLTLYVLSRFNAPLFPLALKLLERRVPCTIQGRDFADKLIETVESLKPTSRSDLDLKLDLWGRKRLKGADKEDPDGARLIADVEDTIQAIRIVADHCGQAVHDISSLIRQLFEGEGTSPNRVTLSTIHRIKGFEADVVFILADTLITKNKLLQKKFKVDTTEYNIEYVAITRAKSELWWVMPDPGSSV